VEATLVVNGDAQQNNQDVEQDFYSTLLTNTLTIYCGFARLSFFRSGPEGPELEG